MVEVKRVSTVVHTRKLDRLIAHKNMERAKLKHVNRHDYYGQSWERVRVDSYFARHWRDTVNVPTIDLREKVK
jgi:hypothetical protein